MIKAAIGKKGRMSSAGSRRNLGTWNIPPLFPSAFTSSSSGVQPHTCFWLRVLSCFNHLHLSLTTLLFSEIHSVLLSLSPVLTLLSLLLHPSFILSLFCTRDHTQTKAAHVGMPLQQIWPRGSLNELFTPSAFLSDQMMLIKTITLSPSLPFQFLKARERVLCDVIWVSPLLKSAKESE